MTTKTKTTKNEDGGRKSSWQLPRSPTENGAFEDVKAGFELILSGVAKLGYEIDNDNFKNSAPRAASGFVENVLPRKEIDDEIEHLTSVSFPVPRCGDPADYGMIISHNNLVTSVCPHHLLPVVSRVDLAYIPQDRVLGTSKLSRLAELIGKQPALQEAYVKELADVLYLRIKSQGSAVVCRAVHTCLACRGARAHDVVVTSTALRGSFMTNLTTRQEFMTLVTSEQKRFGL